MNGRTALIWIVTTGSLAALSRADTALVLNEYNCVDDLKTLENDTPGDGGDTFFGFQRQGDGGNWVEFVVTQDHADLRGWRMDWSNADATANTGSITFTSNPLWSNVRSGTIITVREDDPVPGGTGALPTDTSFNPSRNDWWIHINVDDPAYIDQNHWKVDNDSWQATIYDATGTPRFGPIGEGLNPIHGWGGSGINSQEVGAQTSNPSSTVTGDGFQDLDYSTFGAPNYYNDPITGALISTQDFSGLRGWWANRIPGDADLDGDVDVNDLSILAANWLGTDKDWLTADFSADGLVNAADLGLLAQHWQEGAGGGGQSLGPLLASLGLVPEPASASVVLVIAASTLLRPTRHR